MPVVHARVTHDIIGHIQYQVETWYYLIRLWSLLVRGQFQNLINMSIRPSLFMNFGKANLGLKWPLNNGGAFIIILYFLEV